MASGTNSDLYRWKRWTRNQPAANPAPSSSTKVSILCLTPRTTVTSACIPDIARATCVLSHSLSLDETKYSTKGCTVVAGKVVDTSTKCCALHYVSH